MRTKLSIMVMLGGTLLFAGCKQHQESPTQNQATETPRPAATPLPRSTPPATPKPVAPKPPKPPKPKPLPLTSTEQQVIDDADATGMTARVDRSSDDNAPAADTNRE